LPSLLETEAGELGDKVSDLRIDHVTTAKKFAGSSCWH
jgi:hypothetical protein